jgi:hypothetical protein
MDQQRASVRLVAQESDVIPRAIDLPAQIWVHIARANAAKELLRIHPWNSSARCRATRTLTALHELKVAPLIRGGDSRPGQKTLNKSVFS